LLKVLFRAYRLTNLGREYSGLQPWSLTVLRDLNRKERKKRAVSETGAPNADVQRFLDNSTADVEPILT